MKTLKLDNLLFNHRETVVYYSCPELLIKKSSPYIEIEKNNGEKETLKNLIIDELDDVKSCKYKDRIFLTFGGRHAVLMSLDGTYEYFKINYRHIVTDIHIKDNLAVFGCLFGKLFHFVVYDIEQRKRLYQSQSIPAYTLSYRFGNKYIHVLMGNSQLICYDYECKEVWKRFEHHYIIPGLDTYDGRLIYSSNNQTKITDGKKTDTINVPIVKLDKLEGVIGDNIYGVCSERKNVCCFNLKKEQLTYEIKGDPKSNITKLLITRGYVPGEKKESNVLFFSTDQHLNLVDIDRGNLLFHIGIPKIKEILRNDEIIVRTHIGESHLLREVDNEEEKDSIIEL